MNFIEFHLNAIYHYIHCQAIGWAAGLERLNLLRNHNTAKSNPEFTIAVVEVCSHTA